MNNKVMVMVSLKNENPSLEEIRKLLNVSESDIDHSYGVVRIGDDKFIVLVNEQATKQEHFNGQGFSNPEVYAI